MNTLPTVLTAELLARRERSVARGVATTHPLFIDRGSGATVWDSEGRRYLDFVGGIGTLALGHAHPKIVEAIAAQAARLTHMCFQVAMYEPYVAVAEALNARVPGPTPKKTLLLSTGAEATENAVKIAREYTRRPAVIAFHHGYHGRTLLALSMTGKSEPYKQHFGPFCTEIYHAPFPYEHRGITSERALAGLQDIFDSNALPERIAAFIVEPVLGEGGFIPAPPAFLHALRRIADERGIVLIFDEIQTGFGRTGTFFAAEQYGIEPDLICVAKSLAGGLPLAAVCGKAEIMDAPHPGGLGGTFAGNPVACAAALATFEIMDETFLARARAVGERARAAMQALQRRFDAVADVRGLGPMVAMELRTGAPRVVEEARERGLLLLLAGKRDVVRVLVPFVITDAELDEALGILTAGVEAALA